MTIQVASLVGLGLLATIASLDHRDTSSAQTRFRAAAVGVRLDVLVTEGRRPVLGLTADDFEVRDDGVVQEVRRVDTEELPLHVVLVFDSSGSIRGMTRTVLMDWARAGLGSLRPTDRISLVLFAQRISIMEGGGGKSLAFQKELEGMQPFGATALYDAILTGLLLRDSPQDRAIMIVLSDGRDTASWTEPSIVLDTSIQTDVVVYGMSIGPTAAPLTGADIARIRRRDPDLDIWLGQGHLLEALPLLSGGRVLHASRRSDMAKTLGEVLAEFRSRYVLSYTPNQPRPGWHEVTVALKKRSGKVTARRGYFAEQ